MITHVVELTSGTCFWDYTMSEIYNSPWVPLGMTGSAFHLSTEKQTYNTFISNYFFTTSTLVLKIGT